MKPDCRYRDRIYVIPTFFWIEQKNKNLSFNGRFDLSHLSDKLAKLTYVNVEILLKSRVEDKAHEYDEYVRVISDCRRLIKCETCLIDK